MSRHCTAHRAARAAAENTASALEDVLEQVAPRVQQVGQQAAETLSSTKDTLEELFEQHLAPRVNEAVEKVAPVVAQAYETLSDRIDDVEPKLAALLEQAEPAELEVSTKRRFGLIGKLITVLGLAGLAGGLVVLARKFLGTGDDGWAPAAQGSGWSPEPKVTPAAAKRAAEAATDSEEDEEVQSTGEDVVTEAEETEGYGEGAYVGDNPPEGFVIKGNERSMKYHTPHAAGYERTIADVWFETEAAAQASGFTRATR